MPRIVRVATVCWEAGGGAGSLAGNLEAMDAYLARAALERPDIVLLPEAFRVAGLPIEQWAGHAEPVPGPSTEMCARHARQAGMYVICPLYEREGDALYNTAVLLGRDGRPVGRYRKQHPTIEELQIGVRPGQEPGVFDLDFGRVGLMICFDLYYPEVSRQLGAAGAEIIFWASVYWGGFPLRICAYENRCFVVSSQNRASGYIYDKTGCRLAESGEYRNVVAADVDLEETLFCTDYNAEKLDAIKARYGREVVVTMRYHEGLFALRSLRPDVTVPQVASEFALEALDDFLRRSAAHSGMAAAEIEHMKLRTGHFAVLNEEECQRIYAAGLRVLRRVPLRAQGTEEFLDYLSSFGCRIEGEEVWFPEPVVDALLARIAAHRSGSVHDARPPAGAPDPLAGKANAPAPPDPPATLDYAASGQALWCADMEDDHLRPATTADLAEFSRIVDAIPSLGRAHPTFIPQDAPERTSDLHAFATIALNSAQLHRVSVYSVETLPYFIEVQAIAQGGIEKVREAPVFATKCWWNTPFMLTRENIAIGMKARELLGVPLTIDTMPVAGAATPVSLAGALVLMTAEVLMVNAITLAVDDRLCGFCAGPLALDMRTGAHVQAGPPIDLLRLGASHMGARIFGGTSGASGGPVTGAKRPGAQSMMEKSLQTAWAILGGTRSFGSLATLAYADIGSAVQLLLDLEMMRHFERLLQGITVDEERLAEELICAVAPHGASFLNTDHTAMHFRKELWLPELTDTRVAMAWMREPRTMTDNARAGALRLRDQAPNRCPLSAEQRRAIRQVVSEADGRLGGLRRAHDSL